MAIPKIVKLVDRVGSQIFDKHFFRDLAVIGKAVESLNNDISQVLGTAKVAKHKRLADESDSNGTPVKLNYTGSNNV